MTRMRLVADPFPDIKEPEYVKDAYIGLPLAPFISFSPQEHDSIPRGGHLVQLSHFMEQLKGFCPDSLTWHLAKWNLTEEDIRQVGEHILIEFPFDSLRPLQ